jgi:hypothetical protein
VDTPAVASAENAGTPSAEPGSTANAITRYVDAQRTWVKCIRGQGYDLPDPDAKGFVDIGAFLTRAGMPKTDQGFIAAQEACRSVQPTTPAELDSVPPLTPEQIKNRRAYAKCMRANGMPAWPDPGPNGDWPAEGALGSQTLSPAEQEGNERAIQVCDPVLDGKPPASYDPSKKGQG